MITKTIKTCMHEVIVPRRTELMKIQHIQHLYTPVKATCEKIQPVFDLVKKLHPTPALGGLPKDSCCQFEYEKIEGLESGLYAGPLGWVDSNGNGEFAVGTRSALLQEK